jgi:hypothetical protein
VLDNRTPMKESKGELVDEAKARKVQRRTIAFDVRPDDSRRGMASIRGCCLPLGGGGGEVLPAFGASWAV